MTGSGHPRASRRRATRGAAIAWGLAAATAMAGSEPTERPAPRLEEAAPITASGRFVQPRFALSGRELAFLGTEGGLYRLMLREGAPGPTLAIPGVGFGDAWRWAIRGHAVEVIPAFMRDFGGSGWLRVEPSGAVSLAAGEHEEPGRARIRDGQIEVLVGGTFERWTQGRDPWRDPVVTLDGHFVAAVDERVGGVVMDTWHGRRRYLGDVGRFALSPNDQWLTYDLLTPDPSSDTVVSDLGVMALDEELTAYRLTDTAARDERNPSFAPEGERLAFDAGGAIWIGRLVMPGG